MDRYQIIRINHDIPSRRQIVKFQKIKTLFKNTGTANPLINSGDAVLVVYNARNHRNPYLKLNYPNGVTLILPADIGIEQLRAYISITVQTYGQSLSVDG